MSAQGETLAAMGSYLAPLMQSAVVAALAPVFGPKVYPQVAPDQVDAPYAVYQSILSKPENTIGDGIPIENDHIQLDTYCTSYFQSQRLARAARDALLAIAYPISVVFTSQADQYDVTVKLHRVIQDYSVWQPRGSP